VLKREGECAAESARAVMLALAENLATVGAIADVEGDGGRNLRGPGARRLQILLLDRPSAAVLPEL
jgi:hypothetical protein